MTPIYAIMVGDEWFIAVLATADAYENGASPFDDPVWIDAKTTALLCAHSEAQEIIPLRRTT